MKTRGVSHRSRGGTWEIASLCRARVLAGISRGPFAKESAPKRKVVASGLQTKEAGLQRKKEKKKERKKEGEKGKRKRRERMSTWCRETEDATSVRTRGKWSEQRGASSSRIIKDFRLFVAGWVRIRLGAGRKSEAPAALRIPRQLALYNNVSHMAHLVKLCGRPPPRPVPCATQGQDGSSWMRLFPAVVLLVHSSIGGPALVGRLKTASTNRRELSKTGLSHYSIPFTKFFSSLCEYLAGFRRFGEVFGPAENLRRLAVRGWWVNEVESLDSGWFKKKEYSETEVFKSLEILSRSSHRIIKLEYHETPLVSCNNERMKKNLLYFY